MYSYKEPAVRWSVMQQQLVAATTTQISSSTAKPVTLCDEAIYPLVWGLVRELCV